MSLLPRRRFLLGLGAAAAFGHSRLALAAAPAAGAPDARLVVVILRGALDGLSALPPYTDPDYVGLRGGLAVPAPGQEQGAFDLGGRFGLHPSLAALHAMYAANEALMLHAVAGPWRTRSHFEAQDLLEAGAEQRLASGWLNRALQALPEAPPGTARRGLAVGLDVPLVLRGPAPVGSVDNAPPAVIPPALLAELAALQANDPLLGPAFAEGLRARGFSSAVLAGHAPPPGNRNGFAALADSAARLLAQPQGPRVAALELGGWDTHVGQVPRLANQLAQLDAGLAALKEGLGPAWRQTAILVMTEFGRTARANGTNGTDHGTGGCAFVLGGAVAGGRILADWPGLSEDALLERRDLRPTRDLRAVAKGLLRDHLRLPPAALAQAFPGSDAVAPQGGLLRA